MEAVQASLKCTYFKPEKSLEANYNSVPGGVSRDNWKKLVKYWFSDKGQRLSDCGKEARASQCHFHITGGRSYANTRANYEDKHGEEMSLVQLYEAVHKRKDGSFIESATEDLLIDTQSKAEMLKMTDASGSKPQKVLVHEAFEAVMYGGEIPTRPQGYGFGVVKSNVYGVDSLLRKKGYCKVRKRPEEMENENSTMCALNSKNEELEKQNEELREAVNQNTKLMLSVLEAISSGNACTELLDAARSSLRIANTKGKNDSSKPSGSKDVTSSLKKP